MRRDLTTIGFAIGLIAAMSVPTVAQTSATSSTEVHVHNQQTEKVKAAKAKAEQIRSAARAAAQDKRRQQNRNATQVIVENEVVAPQIVTILHSLSGLKVMRLLRRSIEEPGSVAGFDDAFRMSKEIHTNVIAGLTLDDGETIAAWLPEAEAEMAPPAIHYAPQTPPVPGWPTPADPGQAPPAPHPAPVTPRPAQPRGQMMPPMVAPNIPNLSFFGLLEPDLKIVTRDGKRLLGHYLGLDGLTGLSVITLKGANLPQMVGASEPVKLGQKLRIIGPQPAPRPEATSRTAMYVRVGQTDAIVSGLSKSPSGGIVRIKIKAPKLSAVNIGGIVVNEAGETMGILDTVSGQEATIVPIASVRSAVKRVRDRQASVPKPWLGVRGEPINVVSMDKIMEIGWTAERAKQLCENQNGILLTSVVPGSPAAMNQLKAGDVILTVNNSQIKTGDEFTWILQEAGPGSSVQFTVARPGKEAAEALEIQLSESPDPLFGRRVSSAFGAPRNAEPGSLMSQGIEAMAIKPKAGTRLGASGLLVVYVHPTTSAHKAGLRAGDIIEAIDGQNLTSGRYRRPLIKTPGASSAFSIVRNKQKMQLTIATTR